MAQDGYRLIGAGIYTLLESARLTGISARTIRRWTLGYHYKARGERRYSSPVVKPQLGPVNGSIILSFLDLQEIRFLNAFRSQGVSWHTLRLAEAEARRRVGYSHPFASGDFFAFNRAIFVEIATKEQDLVLENILSNQLLLRQTIDSYTRGLEYEQGAVARWFPTDDRRIVIDPRRGFGQPVTTKEGVPTLVLAKSYRIEKSVSRVSSWYEVEADSVRSAIAFEKRRAA